jgi:hypothetical protein
MALAIGGFRMPEGTALAEVLSAAEVPPRGSRAPAPAGPLPAGTGPACARHRGQRSPPGRHRACRPCAGLRTSPSAELLPRRPAPPAAAPTCLPPFRVRPPSPDVPAGPAVPARAPSLAGRRGRGPARLRRPTLPRAARPARRHRRCHRCQAATGFRSCVRTLAIAEVVATSPACFAPPQPSPRHPRARARTIRPAAPRLSRRASRVRQALGASAPRQKSALWGVSSRPRCQVRWSRRCKSLQALGPLPFRPRTRRGVSRSPTRDGAWTLRRACTTLGLATLMRSWGGLLGEIRWAMWMDLVNIRLALFHVT